MPDPISCIQPFLSPEQALTNIIDSISKEETAIAEILSAEGELIQKMKTFADNLGEYAALNISVNDLMKNLVRLQMLLQLKLEEAQRFIHNDDTDDICTDDYEE